jgi:DNA-binding MarR family transcriptional regulator
VYDASHGIDDVAHGMILAWLDANMSFREIALKLNVSHSTVTRHVDNVDDCGVPIAPSVRQKRRPPPVSAKHRRDIAKRRARSVKLITTKNVTVREIQRARSVVTKRIVKFPFGSPALVARVLKREKFANCSVSTVRRDIRASGLVLRRRPKGPTHSAPSKAQRLRFCTAQLRKSMAWRLRVLFSDEKWFDTDDHGRWQQYCRPDERAEMRTTSQFPPKIIIWAVIGIGFRFIVVHVRKGTDTAAPKAKLGRPRKDEPPREPVQPKSYAVTSKVYVDKCLKPLRAELLKRDMLDCTLMQDGASCHTSAEAAQYIAAGTSRQKLNVMEDWPSHSPELNPIENLWAILAERVSECGPIDEDELEKFVVHEFNRVPQATIDALVSSYTRRLQKCVERGGDV